MPRPMAYRRDWAMTQDLPLHLSTMTAWIMQVHGPGELHVLMPFTADHPPLLARMAWLRE